MKVHTPKVNVVDNFHGVLVEDPYRWLEKSDSPETKQWVEEQNSLTNNYLQGYENRDKIRQRLTELTDYPKYTAPQKQGDYYYYFKNDGLQNQPLFCRTKDFNTYDEEIIIDPHNFSEEGTAAITSTIFNQEGTKLAYAISYKGSDWQEFRVKDLITGKDYPEILKWCKFSSVAWPENGDGFYYNRYPKQDGFSFKDSSYNNRVYWHKLGTSQDEDILIYENPEQKELSFSPKICDSNKYLILNVNNGTEPKTNIYYKTLDGDEEFQPLFKERHAYYTFLGNDNNIFYLYTNNDAPKGKVISIDINEPSKENWSDVLPEQENVISFVKIINKHFVVSKLYNAYNKLKIYDMEGNLYKELNLPKYITISNAQGKQSSDEMFLSYTSFQSPTKILKYNFATDQIDYLFNSEDQYTSNNYTTKQVFYKSKDGTTIPMFLTYKEGLQRTGDNPVLLYGYGGYSISMTPSYSPSQRLWIESGGIYAVANIRGGGEYGEEWHLDATFEKKQNSFDDFMAAAEWLIKEDYTTNNKVAIMGGSNGGLLVGACITQRPELFGAAICLVPVTDMLRFQHFTVGRFWTTEFGNAETNPEHFKFMYKYSPLHNAKEREYPATLITTADTDDRVAPLHAKKFAATLQEAQTGEQPILLRVEKGAGHGLGKPTSKIIDEQTDIYAFLFKQFNMTLS